MSTTRLSLLPTTILKDTLIGGDVTNGPAVKAAAFAAKVHAATHASAINGHMRDVYKERFNNPALCDITNTYVG